MSVERPLSVNSNWSEILSVGGSLLWPLSAFPKRMALAAMNNVDLVALTAVASCFSSVKQWTWDQANQYIWNHLVEDAIAQWEEPTINMQVRWKDTSSFGGVSTKIAYLWARCVWQYTPPAAKTPELLSEATLATPCFFNERVEQTVKELLEGSSEHIKAERPFQNAILYGPPGVGKTKILKELAIKFPGNYLFLSSSALREAMRSGTHLREVKKIFKKIENSPDPTILVIDECELVFMDRKLQLMQPGTADSYDLLEALLKYTGTPSNKFMVVLATNNLRIIDDAILDRMDYKVDVGLPALRERIAIIRANISLKFREADQNIWTDQMIEAVAVATEGFSGRCLEKLLTRIALKCGLSDAKELTNEMIAQGLFECVSEHFEAAMTINPQLRKDIQAAQLQQQMAEEAPVPPSQ